MNAFIQNDGGRAEAGFKGNASDCVTRSISIASGMDYLTIYNALALVNKSTRRGSRTTKSVGRKSARNGIYTQRSIFKEFMRSLNFRWVACMGIGTGCTVHLCAEELPAGNLVVAVSRHYTAMIDGVIHDTYDPSRDGKRCVYGYWIIGGQE